MNTLAWAWMNRAAWVAMASTTWGWLCPVELTAMPAAKSRYSSPSTVVTRHPRPLATCRSVTLNHTFDRCDIALRLRLLRVSERQRANSRSGMRGRGAQ